MFREKVLSVPSTEKGHIQGGHQFLGFLDLQLSKSGCGGLVGQLILITVSRRPFKGVGRSFIEQMAVFVNAGYSCLVCWYNLFALSCRCHYGVTTATVNVRFLVPLFSARGFIVLILSGNMCSQIYPFGFKGHPGDCQSPHHHYHHPAHYIVIKILWNAHDDAPSSTLSADKHHKIRMQHSMSFRFSMVVSQYNL